MPKRKDSTRTSAARAASLASRAAAAAPADGDDDEAHDDDDDEQPVWRQLDDVCTTAAPFDCGGFGEVRASTAPSACLLLDGLSARSMKRTVIYGTDVSHDRSPVSVSC